MLDGPAILTCCRRALAAAVIACFTLTAASASAVAQQVIMVVNGDPITTFDVEQRTRFLTLANNGKTPARQEVMDELIDERLKLQLTRRFDFGASSIDNDVENAITNMARRAHKSRLAFAQDLEKQGVLIGTLKSRIKAEIIWTQVIRGKFQSSLQFNDQEILKEIETNKKEDVVGYDYSLRPIIFVVPRGSAEPVFEARRREAENLRLRFENCTDGVVFARAVAHVRDLVTRSSSDLPAQLREILNKTEIGKLTPPERTMQGVELYALCGKKQSSADNTPAKREAREKLYADQFKIRSEKYLKELRAQAYIVNK